MDKTPNQLKHYASMKLRKYDKKCRELRKLEQELHAACVAYGKTQGYGERYNRDHLRTRLLVEQEQKAKAGRKAA